MINVGVYLNDYKNSDVWENIILDEISREKNFNVILIKNEVKFEKKTNKKTSALKFLLLHFQIKIENIVLKTFSKKSKNQKIKKSFLKENNFDFIVNFSHNIKKEILIEKANIGLLEVFKDSFLIYKYNLLCINEVVKKMPCVNLKLKVYNKKINKGVFIEDMFFTYDWKGSKNLASLSVRVSKFLIKNINIYIINEREYNICKNKTENFEERISIYTQFIYIIKFYLMIFKRFYKSLLYKFFNRKKDNWTLVFGNNYSKNKFFKNLKPVVLPKDEFWADPFLFKFKKEYYVFFEKYINKIGRGIISCGKLVNGEINDIEDVLITDYHLSYPNVFEEEGEIYMIPEISEKRRLEIYKCINFPNQWELYSYAFDGEYVVDTIYYKDENNNKWLFLSKTNNNLNDNCSELYIYQIDSLKLNKVINHKQNPIFADCRKSRNAGAILKLNNKLIRPSQNNSYGIYGYNINFNQIKVLNIEEYKEENIKIHNNSFKKYKRVHHFHFLDEIFVFDCYLN
ncbi:hypothetical protein C7447_10432 [Tenacibaculum adriaticum]|uniref:Glucosamine inositolphosphorylceramide transferase 1 N-terminal domain-containing protein n=1 Tax=Tenacibaculum adriaticum TaxID=413713 RepID=A0A5S5DPP8_9FLAO|nr:hypothetical protein [Tenacibaculum adriaticum]TYP97348.1 hypothetical protein C7447_10432 [Tenacibaculum adriaticum]